MNKRKNLSFIGKELVAQIDGTRREIDYFSQGIKDLLDFDKTNPFVLNTTLPRFMEIMASLAKIKDTLNDIEINDLIPLEIKYEKELAKYRAGKLW